MEEDTTIDRASQEIAHQWQMRGNDNATVEYLGIPELCHFLESCGIRIDKKERYALTLRLRSEGYLESRLDGELRFHFYS